MCNGIEVSRSEKAVKKYKEGEVMSIKRPSLTKSSSSTYKEVYVGHGSWVMGQGRRRVDVTVDPVGKYCGKPLSHTGILSHTLRK